MLYAAALHIREQELVSLGTTETFATAVTSRIGFGKAGYPDDSSTCEIVAKHAADNVDKFIKTMGYILVQ